ncbi:hypothetical protein FOFC_18228, partial [Fusarium oxysporum]
GGGDRQVASSSQQTASRVGSDGLRPEFRRLASLRLNKTGRNDPTEGVNVKECCAMCRGTSSSRGA